MTTVRTRLMLAVSLVLALGLVLAACAPADSGGETGASLEEQIADEGAGDITNAEDVITGTEDVEADAEMVEGDVQLLTWSSSESEQARLEEVIASYEEQSNVTVGLNVAPSYNERLQTSLAGGSPPDAFYVDSSLFPNYASAGALAPIGDEMANPDDFYENLRAAFTWDGEFYCPPKDVATLGLFYNEDLFAEAGVDAPTSDWTWDELRNAAQQITEAGLEVDGAPVLGMSLSPDFARLIAFIYQAGGSVTSDDLSEMTINSPEALEAVNYYVNLVLDGFADQPANLDSGWNGEAFGKQRAAMVVEGNWMVPYLSDSFPDVNWGVAELPAGPGGQATMGFTVCYGAPANNENPEASVDLINYLTGEEGMREWTDLGIAMPARQSLSEGWLEQYPDLEPLLAGTEYARPWSFFPGFSDLGDAINSDLEQALNGAILPEQLLENAQEVGTEVINR